MSSDGKIGQVGGVSRTAPVRKIADSTLAAGATPLRTAAPDALAGASLIRIASDLASMPPPVDSARVASLRTAMRAALEPKPLAAPSGTDAPAAPVEASPAVTVDPAKDVAP